MEVWQDLQEESPWTDNNHWLAVWKSQSEQKTASQTWNKLPKTPWKAALHAKKKQLSVPFVAPKAAPPEPLSKACNGSFAVWLWVAKTAANHSKCTNADRTYGVVSKQGYPKIMTFIGLITVPRGTTLLSYLKRLHIDVPSVLRMFPCSGRHSPSQQRRRCSDTSNSCARPADWLMPTLFWTNQGMNLVRSRSIFVPTISGFITETCQKPGCRCIVTHTAGPSWLVTSGSGTKESCSIVNGLV